MDERNIKPIFNFTPGTTSAASVSLKKGHGGPGLDTSYPLGLALSGGGHRASLFGLGVLLAMRDAGKSPEQISSVSGGSITNAYLAHHYFARSFTNLPDVPKDDERHWQDTTAALYERIVRQGAVSKAWITMIVLFLVAPPVSFVVLALRRELPSWYYVLPFTAVWATVLLLRGLIIEWLLQRSYFETTPVRSVGDLVRRFAKSAPVSTLADLSNPDEARHVEHVICCTDLVTGHPLYFSSRTGGTIHRRTNDRPDGLSPRTVLPYGDKPATEQRGVTYPSPRLDLATAIRASAGFPGIPPRRLSLARHRSDLLGNAQDQEVPPVAFLSDGGVWNNLATQPFDDGYLMGPYGPWVVLVADASAPQTAVSPRWFHVPLLAEVMALVRQASILNTNTVSPRRSLYHEVMRQELGVARSARFRHERLYPVVSISDSPDAIRQRILSPVMKAVDRTFIRPDEGDRQESYRVRTLRRAIELQPDSIAHERSGQWYDQDLGVTSDEWYSERVKVDSEAAVTYGRLQHLAGCATFNPERGSEDKVSRFQTTLGHVDREIARAIVARGYANASLTMYLCGLSDQLVFPTGWLAKEAANATDDASSSHV